MKTQKEQLEELVLSINQDIKHSGLHKDDSCIIKLEEGTDKDGNEFMQLEFCNRITRIEKDGSRNIDKSKSGFGEYIYMDFKKDFISNVFRAFIKTRDVLGNFNEKTNSNE